MAEPGTTHFRHRDRRSGLRLGLFAVLALIGAVLAMTAGEMTPVPVAETSLPRAVAAPAADVTLATDLPAAPRQRHLLILLRMNSAGPIGPYGVPGR